MPDLPSEGDFKPELTISVVRNPETLPPTNVLILLHGLGDSEVPFAKLGSQLNLPHTCVLAVRGLFPLPFDLNGYHWSDDINFNQATGTLDPDAGFSKGTDLLVRKLLQEMVVSKYGFRPRNIVLWGFGQGGMAALAMVNRTEDEEKSSLGELGGIITIGGPLPESIYARSKKQGKLKTPVLALGGSSGTLLGEEQTERLRRLHAFVEKITWRRKGDGMPRDREEMMPIMQFLARRLQAAAPAGSEEISP